MRLVFVTFTSSKFPKRRQHGWVIQCDRVRHTHTKHVWGEFWNIFCDMLDDWIHILSRFTFKLGACLDNVMYIILLQNEWWTHFLKKCVNRNKWNMANGQSTILCVPFCIERHIDFLCYKYCIRIIFCCFVLFAHFRFGSANIFTQTPQQIYAHVLHFKTHCKSWIWFKINLWHLQVYFACQFFRYRTSATTNKICYPSIIVFTLK